MGKTIKCKNKAKAKAMKAKSKAKRKAVKAAAAFLLLALCGCATSDSAQPAKSQTLSVTFEDSVVVVAPGGATVSNGVVKVEGAAAPTVELITQTQSLESSGSESFAQTATQTPTADVKPDLDVRYNDAIAGATTASKGVIDTLTGTAKAKVLSMMESKGTGTVEVEKTDGTKATVKCENGQCSFCEDCPAK